MQSATTTTVVEKALRPFHETIVEDIERATNEELVFIARQLKRTLIPANHDEISAAWNGRRKHMHFVNDEDIRGVLASLLMQKEAAEAKAARLEKSGIELHELQQAMETFLSLSHNHHLSGSMISWHVRLWERLENLHRLFSQALGK